MISGSKQSYDSTFRVLAFANHGNSVAELERPAGDGLQVQHTYRNVDKSGTHRMKSAEELHFEAIQDYYLRYENEGGCHRVTDDANDVIRPDASSPETHVNAAVVEDDEANTPVDESKYLDVWHGDQNALHYPANGREAALEKNSDLEKQTPALNDVAEPIIPIKVCQSPSQADGKSAERKKSTPMNTVQSGPRKSSAKRPPQLSQSTLLQNSTVTASDLESSQHQSESDNEEDMQHKNPPTKDEGMQSEEENTKSEVNGDLSEEQKIRMELNKAAALARRNMRICEEVVIEVKAKGLSFPKFESLLVEKSWVEILGIEFQKQYMERLHQFVSQEAAGRIPIYPPPAKLFNAFNSCPFDKVKVVIIGQDPYHGPGQATGLCFSVEKGIKLPSSLTNIFLEIESDLNCDFPSHGNLEKWAHQGVLLLNTVLTVRDHHANSHAKKGWEIFTDAAIRALAQQRSGVVFLLWGNQAQEKLRLINKTSHHILKAFHPSGVSAHRGFFKCRHFSKTNQILVDQGSLPVDWQL